jgi:hypothetical protein
MKLKLGFFSTLLILSLLIIPILFSLVPWLLNGDYAGSNPTLPVPLVDSYDVQAVFCPSGYETRYSLTVDGVNWFFGLPVDDAVFIDGQYVGQTNAEFSVCQATILFRLERILSGFLISKASNTRTGATSTSTKQILR